MKIIKNLFLVSYLFISLSIITSCSDDDKVADTPKPAGVKSIAEIIESVSTASVKPEFKLLNAALKKTGYDALLKDSKQTLTIFAPTDQAFQAFLGAGTIEGTSVDVLKSILNYHVVKSIVRAADIKDGANYLNTIAFGNASAKNGLSVFIFKKDSENIFFNGNSDSSPKVKLGDAIVGNNGVVHSIDKVISNSQLTVKDQVLLNDDFKKLTESLVAENLVDAVDEAGKTYTVFAPNNGAFDNLDKTLKKILNKTVITIDGVIQPESYKYLNGITSLPAGTVAEVLKYHVVKDKNLNSSDLAGIKETDIMTVQGANIKFFAAEKPYLEDNLKGKREITTVDIQCTNGVIHIIKDVLIPLTSL